MEGLFRVSASLSLVEYWKDKFNQGMPNSKSIVQKYIDFLIIEPDVDLTQCSDVHAVAGLLK